MDVTPPTTGGAGTSQLASAYSTVRTSVLVEAATKLGISPDRLRAELDAGKPLAHIAALAGVSLAVEQPAAAPALQEAPRDVTVDVRL